MRAGWSRARAGSGGSVAVTAGTSPDRRENRGENDGGVAASHGPFPSRSDAEQPLDGGHHGVGRQVFKTRVAWNRTHGQVAGSARNPMPGGNMPRVRRVPAPRIRRAEKGHGRGPHARRQVARAVVRRHADLAAREQVGQLRQGRRRGEDGLGGFP